MRRTRRKKLPEISNNERWLLTYADLITLLLAFFIVMYSMSQIDAKRFGKVSKALHGILKGGNGVLRYEEFQSQEGHGVLKVGDLKMLQAEVEKQFNSSGKDEELQTEITERGLVIHIVESALFREGSSDMLTNTIDVLDRVYEQIGNIPNHIRVEGHTDDRTIKTARYPSNWELSSARATEVVRYFIDNYGFPANRISALGYGEYRPVRPNTSIENRALNRRVDIVILTMEMSLKEPSSQMYDLQRSGQEIPG